MLRFFRQIRQRLLTDNKFSKYLLYAVGEILLVVIGILIALQFNTWSEERKLSEERLNILKNLKIDLENDIKNYNKNIGRLELRNDIANEMLALLEHVPSELDSSDTVRKLLILGYIEDHNPSFATYNEIQGSGKLGLLTSNELKTGLADYRSDFENFKLIDNNWKEDIKDYERIMSGYFSGNIPLQNYDLLEKAGGENSNLRFDLEEMAANRDLVSRIRHIAYFTKIQIDIKRNALLPVCRGLIRQIESELPE